MYEYRGLQDIFFIVLYGGVAFLAVAACLYLLFRRGNIFAGDVSSSRVLRRWTAAFMAAIAASHVWWYVIGIYWLTDDRLVRNITTILLDLVTLVPLMMGVLLAMLQDRKRPLWPWLVAQIPVVVAAVIGIIYFFFLALVFTLSSSLRGPPPRPKLMPFSRISWKSLSLLID